MYSLRILTVSLLLFCSIQTTAQERINLGSEINSEFDELAPVISPDGTTLFFCRDKHPKNIGRKKTQDIWVSRHLGNGRWSEAENIGKPLNDDLENYVNSVTPDGNVLLLGNIYKKKGEGFSISYKNGDKWTKPEKIPIKNYYNRSKFASAYLSNNEKVLLLGCQRDDSYGDVDLYVSFIGDDGIWSEPMNLGSTINTKYYDDAPFLASDGLTLYFASKGHSGKGADIYMSRRLDKSWQKWSEPQNLGSPFNTSGDDISFFITARGDYAYFSSTESSMGGQDIFKASIPEKFKPKPVVMVSGKVINSKTRKPIEAEVMYETLPDGEEAGVARTNPETGEYKIVLPSGSKYGYRAEAKGFMSVNQNLDLTKSKDYYEIEKNLELVPIEKGSNVVLNNIFFDFNKSKLDPESYPELKRLVNLLKEYSDMQIEVAGYTDNVGSDDYNLKLSESRAKAVAYYIISQNVDKNRIISKGYGKANPIGDNKTEEGRHLNRRVEFIIIKY